MAEGDAVAVEDKRRAWSVAFAVLLVVVALGWGAMASSGGGDDSEETARVGDAADPGRPSVPSGQPSPEEPAPSSEAPRKPQPVLYFGDSFAMEVQKILGTRIEDTGRATYSSESVAGTTLCDYLEGRKGELLVKAKDKAAALVRKHKPRVIVLQFRGNVWGYTPCMSGLQAATPEYYARYEADTRAMTEQITRAAEEAGIERPKIVWVLQPPDAMEPEWMKGVNDIYKRQAAASGDLTADAGKVLGDSEGKWAEQLPCTEHERKHGSCTGGSATMHTKGDPVHFCLVKAPEGGRPCPAESPGLVRYSQVVAKVVGGYLAGV